MFDRSKVKPLDNRADDREKAGAAAMQRPGGFGGEPAQGASVGGFGRRKTPIAETTDGAPPSVVANDREARPDKLAVAAGAEAAVPSTEMARELATWLSHDLRRGKQVQHEAVLCALGALAGYAAQQAIREALVKTGKLGLEQAFVVIETRSGDVFFFGDLLNAVIASEHDVKSGAKATGHASIWKIVSEAGYEAGAINLPDVNDMIKHCAATVGRDEFGLPRVPDTNMPEILPLDAVSRYWPETRRRMANAEPMSWPLHLAMAAGKMIVALKDVLRPDIAVQIVMEAAVPMSKIDPMTLPKE